MYDAYDTKDYHYNDRVICQVQGVDELDGKILIKLPNNYNKIGSIEGWFGHSRTDREIKEYGLKTYELYWWIRSWRLIAKKMDLE